MLKELPIYIPTNYGGQEDVIMVKRTGDLVFFSVSTFYQDQSNGPVTQVHISKISQTTWSWFKYIHDSI